MPLQSYFTFDFAKLSQRLHLSSINFTLTSKLGVSESSTHRIRFFKKDFFLFTQSPDQKEAFFVLFCCFCPIIYGEGTFPGFLHYVVVTYSISPLLHARPHLPSLCGIKIPATVYYR